METNSFRKYSILAIRSKLEEQQPMKACLDDSMRTSSGTEASVQPTYVWILDRYDKYLTALDLQSQSFA